MLKKKENKYQREREISVQIKGMAKESTEEIKNNWDLHDDY